MSIEIEAKMRLHNTAEKERKLSELGGTLHGEVLETNMFFDTAEDQLKTTDQGLRIRVENTPDNGPATLAGEALKGPAVELPGAGVTTTITHKGPRAHGKLKSRSETELKVEDARHATALLTALGFQRVLSFEKRRRRWMLDGCHVELDTLPHLGEYIEIEGPDEEAVYAVREKLGLADQPLIRTSYIALMMTYLNEQHITSRHIRFDPAPAQA